MKPVLVHLISAGSTFLAASIAHGGPLQPQRVGADAEWLVHINVESLASSQLVQYVMKNHGELDVDLEGMDEFKEHFGIEPLKDIKDVTVYGSGNPHHLDHPFVAIITATSAVDALIDHLKEQADQYNEEQINGQSVRKFHGHGHDVYFQMLPGQADDRVIVVSTEATRFSQAWAVAQGNSPSLADKKDGVLKKSPRSGSFLFAAVEGMGWLLEEDHEEHAEHDVHNPATSFLHDAKSLVVDLGEADENMFIEASVGTDKEETATNLADVARGFIAMGKLAANNDPDLAPLKNLMNGIRLTNQSSTFTVAVQQKTKVILETLEKMHRESVDDDEDHDADDHNAAKGDSKSSVNVSVHVGPHKKSD